MAPNTSNTGVKTDEKKQHFDDIYVEPTPVPYKTRILDALSYVSDDFNREMFDSHILPFANNLASSRKVNFVDLCSCFGNTTMATIHGMTYDDIRENWKDEESCRSITKVRRFDTKVTGIDISAPALAYGKEAGVYDEIICSNLNERETAEFVRVKEVMSEADILLSTAALVYLDLETIEALISSFAKGNGDDKQGYILVNFLNPFALEKADETKRILLKHLEFVGSRATRHRRMSELEMRNYPGEEWSLLELWVLKRRS
jgi:SAM-dependent methyltransferase